MADLILTGKECAALLKVEYGYFMRVVRYRNGFPKELEFNRGGRPRWSAEEVKNYALGIRAANNVPGIYPRISATC